MKLEFLQISKEKATKEAYPNATELISVELVEGDTYKSLFDKVRVLFLNNCDCLAKQKAINKWLEKYHLLRKDDFEDIIVTEGVFYANFNLRDENTN